jgi:hypothetical protein
MTILLTVAQPDLNAAVFLSTLCPVVGSDGGSLSPSFTAGYLIA